MTSKPAGSSSGLPSRRTLITSATAGAAALAVSAAGAASAAAPGTAGSAATSGTALAPAATGSDWNACLTVARAILVRDEQDQPLVPGYRDILLSKGLPRSRKPPRRC